MSSNKTNKPKIKKKPSSPNVKKLRAIKFNKRFYACHQIHQLLGISRSMVGAYCAEGLVPHCRRLSNDWIIAKAGAMFLARWYCHRKELGTLWKRTVMKAAVKADPACLVRQQEYRKRNPSVREHELDLEDVLTIRERIKAGELLEDIAADYDMDQSAIYYIGDGRSYPLPNTIRLPA